MNYPHKSWYLVVNVKESGLAQTSFAIIPKKVGFLPYPSLYIHRYINADQNVNYFNVDMVYTWQFAPGSFLNVVCKNAVQDYTNTVEESYFKNLGNTMEADQNNNISLKVIYFLDYLQLKKKKTKN